MPEFVVSDAALSDIRGITRYTVKNWGGRQAVRYVTELLHSFQLLAKNPGIGRACDDVSAGPQRYEQGKHVIFYRVTAGGIRIIRVLHQRMLPAKPRFEA